MKIIVFELGDKVDENQILAGLSKLLGEVNYNFGDVSSEVLKIVNYLKILMYLINLN